MPKVREYPDLFTYRKSSVLSEDVQRAARDLGVAFQRKAVTAELVSAFRNSLRGIPAESVPRGASEMREIAQMNIGYGHREPVGIGSGLLRSFGIKRKSPDTALQDHPDLGWLLMFHESGYVRQAAMEALTTSPNCPFEVAAVVYRLNDWVANVRAASMSYARKSLVTAGAEAICESAFFLLPQTTCLHRWDDEGLSIVKDTIYRPDVLNKLREQFLMPRSGEVGQSLRLILQRADFDSSIEQLALDAKLPTVRAIAIEALLMKRARWFVGYRREWVNKVYGVSRRVAEFAERKVEIEFETIDILEAAAQDKSSTVRRIAANFLILNREELTPKMAEILEALKRDRCAAVRSRIDFIARKMAEA
ncbi:hypothetical protein FMN50_00100 [Rhodobacterales bacterium]|nr:hypothetical protein FMN50_00100 [Rhodobacterales bacterium]